METINTTLFISFVILLIFETFLRGKLFKNKGINIYKNEYKLKNNYLKNNIGNTIKKDDVDIKIINEYLCFFNASRVIFPTAIGFTMYGCIEIVNDYISVRYKKPFSYFLLILLILINIINEIVNKKIMTTLIVVSIFGTISMIINIFKFQSVKLDIEYFIEYGK